MLKRVPLRGVFDVWNKRHPPAKDKGKGNRPLVWRRVRKKELKAVV